MWLFLALLIIPIIEIALFIQIGDVIGLLPTLGTVVLTAVIGTYLLRAQGLQTIAKLQGSVQAGEDPRGPLAHGALILIAGIVLLTPGFFTDAIGFLLLMPPVRAAIIAWAAKHMEFAVAMQQSSNGFEEYSAKDDIIEGEFDEVPEVDPNAPRGNSGWTKNPD